MDSIQKRVRSAVSSLDMKISNKKAILEMLNDKGPLSRTELACQSGLSKATVSSLVNELIKVNLVLETGAIQSSGVGRNAIELTFNASYGYVIAVDVGRFWIRFAISDLNGDVLELHYRESSISKTLDDVIELIFEGINQLVSKLGVQLMQILSLCVSAPGVIDSEGIIKNALAIPQLNGVNLKKCLSKILPSTSILIENDIRVAAVAENWKGVGKRYKTFVLLGIGSGLGCGFIINGQLFSGAYGAAGEIGFLKTSITEDTPIEYDLSSSGIVQAANHLIAGGETYFSNVKSVFLHVAEDIHQNQIFIDWLVKRVVYLIEIINYMINPEAIVLGGGIGRHLSFLLPILRENISKFIDRPQLEISGFDENVQIIGATNIAINRVREDLLESAENPER
jgi:glucokinase